MMTPREIILANITHNGPDRPGVTFSLGPQYVDDMPEYCFGASPTWTQRRWVEGRIEYYDDEWGNIWARFIDGCLGGEIHEPAIKDWRQLDTLKIPDYDNPLRYEHIRKAFAADNTHFRLVSLRNWIFATARYLRKMEIYFMDLIEYPDQLHQLHKIIADLLERCIHQVGQAGADGITFAEDLGIQDRTLMHPAMWHEFFFEHYKRLTDVAHSYGMKVLMHSCGYNWALIDDLCDAGIDCFQFDQPAAYDMPALAEKFRQRQVALWSPIDIQRILPTGDRQKIEDFAQYMVDTFRGCVISKNYGDLNGIGVQPRWNDWGYNALLRASGLADKQIPV